MIILLLGYPRSEDASVVKKIPAPLRPQSRSAPSAPAAPPSGTRALGHTAARPLTEPRPSPPPPAADWLSRPRGAARPRPVPRRPLRAPRRLRSGRGRCCGGAGQDGGRAGGRRRQQRRRQRERDGGRERSGGARHPRAPDSLLLVGAALGRGSSAAVAHGAQPGAGPGGGGQLGHPVPEREEAARLPRQRLRPERHHASRAPEAWLRRSSSFGNTVSLGEPAKKHTEAEPAGQGKVQLPLDEDLWLVMKSMDGGTSQDVVRQTCLAEGGMAAVSHEERAPACAAHGLDMMVLRKRW